MKKVLVLFPLNTRPLDGYPYILNIIKMLCEKGVCVDILINEEAFQDLGIENFSSHIIGKQCSDYEYAKKSIDYLNKHNNEYSFILSFSIVGLWIQLYNIMFHKNKLKGAYFSMELFDFSKKPKKIFMLIWIFFKWLLKYKLEFLVIQDEHRAKVLKRYASFADKIFLLPNSYIGFDNNKTDFANIKWGIPQNKKILLYTGGIEGWAFDMNLPQNLNKLLEKDYILLLSGCSRDDTAEKLQIRYKDLIDQKKMIISLDHLDEKNYTKLVQSAYIGLPWYKKQEDILSIAGQNLYYIGLSSGKLCKYLSNGLPVILPEFYHGYKDLVEKEKFGQVCDYSDLICEKIEEIAVNYRFYCDNVKRYYLSKIEYEIKATPIIDEIIRYLQH